MAAMRFLAGLLEIGGATLMLRLGKVEQAFQVNAWLGIIGPTVFLVVSSLGLAGMIGPSSAPESRSPSWCRHLDRTGGRYIEHRKNHRGIY